MNQDVRKTFTVKAIYGSVTVLAVLAVMREHPPTVWLGAITVLTAALAVALLDLYCETVGEILHGRRPLTRTEFRNIWRHIAPVLVGAQAAIIVLFVSRIAFISDTQAIDIASTILFVFLFIYGVRVGRILHTRWHMQIVSGLLVVGIAALVVVIKSLPLFH